MEFEIERLPPPPPLPLVAQRLLAMFSDETVDMADLARLIETDPSITGRIVGIANSAYFGTQRRIFRAEQALVKLGLDLVRSLTLSMVLSGPFRVDQCPGFPLDRYWFSALMTAACARHLASHVTAAPRPTADQAFLGGLLHNLGLLALAHAYPVEMDLVFTQIETPSDADLILAARDLMGLDHHRVGAWLSRSWHLPEEASAVLQYHADPTYRGEHWPLCLLVGLCSRWSEVLAGHTASPPQAFLEQVLGALGILEETWRTAVSSAGERGAELEPIAGVLAQGG